MAEDLKNGVKTEETKPEETKKPEAAGQPAADGKDKKKIDWKVLAKKIGKKLFRISELIFALLGIAGCFRAFGRQPVSPEPEATIPESDE